MDFLKMDFMNQDKKELVKRLAICVVVALVICYGGEKLFPSLKLPFWDTIQPWLEKNKLQAVVVVAGVLFLVSTMIMPLAPPDHSPGEEPCPPDSGYEPCEPFDPC